MTLCKTVLYTIKKKLHKSEGNHGGFIMSCEFGSQPLSHGIFPSLHYFLLLLKPHCKIFVWERPEGRQRKTLDTLWWFKCWHKITSTSSMNAATWHLTGVMFFLWLDKCKSNIIWPSVYLISMPLEMRSGQLLWVTLCVYTSHLNVTHSVCILHYTVVWKTKMLHRVNKANPNSTCLLHHSQHLKWTKQKVRHSQEPIFNWLLTFCFWIELASFHHTNNDTLLPPLAHIRKYTSYIMTKLGETICSIICTHLDQQAEIKSAKQDQSKTPSGINSNQCNQV